MNEIENETIRLLKEYSARGLPLGVDDIHLFLAVQVKSRDIVFEVVEKLQKKGEITEYGQTGHYFYTEESSDYGEDLVNYKNKLQTVVSILNIISRIPFVLFVGVTGSGELEYMKKSDDIDIVVVIKNDTLFTTRALIVILLILFGKKRSKLTPIQADSICLNLLLEERNLRAPFAKRTIFSAKEIAKIRSFYDQDRIFESLKRSNLDWVQSLLPNYEVEDSSLGGTLHDSTSSVRLSVHEKLLAFLQLWYMKRGVTNEIITDKYLFLHPIVRGK